MIKIGQDAFGLWAWMLFAMDGRLVASGDDYLTAEGALSFAMVSWLLAKERGEPGIPAHPHISFPEGWRG